MDNKKQVEVLAMIRTIAGHSHVDVPQFKARCKKYGIDLSGVVFPARQGNLTYVKEVLEQNVKKISLIDSTGIGKVPFKLHGILKLAFFITNRHATQQKLQLDNTLQQRCKYIQNLLVSNLEFLTGTKAEIQRQPNVQIKQKEQIRNEETDFVANLMNIDTKVDQRTRRRGKFTQPRKTQSDVQKAFRYLEKLPTKLVPAGCLKHLVAEADPKKQFKLRLKTHYQLDIFKLKEKNRSLARRAWNMYGLKLGPNKVQADFENVRRWDRKQQFDFVDGCVPSSWIEQLRNRFACDVRLRSQQKQSLMELKQSTTVDNSFKLQHSLSSIDPLKLRKKQKILPIQIVGRSFY